MAQRRANAVLRIDQHIAQHQSLPVEEGGDGRWLVGFKVLSSGGTDSDAWRELLQQV